MIRTTRDSSLKAAASIRHYLSTWHPGRAAVENRLTFEPPQFGELSLQGGKWNNFQQCCHIANTLVPMGPYTTLKRTIFGVDSLPFDSQLRKAVELTQIAAYGRLMPQGVDLLVEMVGEKAAHQALECGKNNPI